MPTVALCFWDFTAWISRMPRLGLASRLRRTRRILTWPLSLSACRAWEPTPNLADAYGKAYIFTRSGTVWTQQATLLGDNHVGDNFGIGLGFSGDSLIVGARGATAVGTARAGAAFVYRLPHTLANIS